jgi:hypothetical protein
MTKYGLSSSCHQVSAFCRQVSRFCHQVSLFCHQVCRICHQVYFWGSKIHRLVTTDCCYVACMGLMPTHGSTYTTTHTSEGVCIIIMTFFLFFYFLLFFLFYFYFFLYDQYIQNIKMYLCEKTTIFNYCHIRIRCQCLQIQHNFILICNKILCQCLQIWHNNIL